MDSEAISLSEMSGSDHLNKEWCLNPEYAAHVFQVPLATYQSISCSESLPFIHHEELLQRDHYIKLAIKTCNRLMRYRCNVDNLALSDTDAPNVSFYRWQAF